MSNFRGSKEKWVAKNNCIYKEEHIRPNVAGGRPIAFINGTDFFKPDEIKANTLLISKAPEMLDFLNEMYEYYSGSERIAGSLRDFMIRANRLIKEATEL